MKVIFYIIRIVTNIIKMFKITGFFAVWTRKNLFRFELWRMHYFQLRIDFYRLTQQNNTAKWWLSNLNLQKYQIFIDLEGKNYPFFWHENFGHGGSIERDFCPWDIPICTKTMAFTFPFQNFFNQSKLSICLSFVTFLPILS